MRSSLYLMAIYVLVYISFLYLQLATNIYLENKPEFNKLGFIFVGVQVFVLLLGGILAAFVIRASILLIISIICLFFGFIIFEIYNSLQIYKNIHKIDYYFLYFGVVTLGIFCGLSRFIFQIFIINQKNSKFIKMKIMLLFILMDLSYLIAYAIFPSPYSVNVKYSVTIPAILYIIAMVLLISGKYFGVYEIRSRILNIMNIIKTLKNKEELFYDKNVGESKEVLISVSRAVIFLILMTPYGICAAQLKYAFRYQFNHFKFPKIRYCASENKDFWPILMRSITVIIFGPIIIGLTKYSCFRNLYSNVKIKLIVGYILMITAIFISGGLETYWLNNSCDYNLTNNCSNCVIEQMWNNSSKAADISSFIMVPSIVLSGLSEVIMIPTCLEILFKLSLESTKYLSIAFLFAATAYGGFPDFISLLIHSIYKFNEMKIVNGFKMCSIDGNRLDNFLYIIGGCALFSLLLSIILMLKFSFRFTFINKGSNDQLMEQN